MTHIGSTPFESQVDQNKYIYFDDINAGLILLTILICIWDWKELQAFNSDMTGFDQNLEI